MIGMNKVTVSVKTDKDTKEGLQQLASQLGLSFSALVNAQFRQLLRTRRIVLDDNYPTMEVDEATAKELDEAYKDIKAGKVNKDFTNIDDFIRDLEA